jgi:hypothetical protein
MAYARDRWTNAAVPLLYLAVSFLYFGLPVASHPGRSLIGAGVDSQIFVWSFAWWPHAIGSGENPFYTHAIWAPEGVNLAWTTSVPLLALVFAPLTALAGPVVSYNAAAVLMPALAAWTAFLLCRHLTGRFWPSLAGGYLFGFSAYMLGHQEGHLHMTSVFLLPLVALVVVRYVEGELDGRALALLLGLLIAAQLGFSTEHAFTLTLALGVALLLAFAFDPARRPRLQSLVRPLLGGYALALALASPLLYYALSDFESRSINRPENFPADLLNFVVPTGLVAFSQDWGMSGLASRFLGNDAEAGAYLGFPTLAIVGLYAWRRRRTPGGRFLVGSFAVAALAALGTALHVAGERVVSLPYGLLARLPLFNNVLPVRYALYASLAAAVMVAAWAASPGRTWLRVLLPALAVVALFPHFGKVPYLGHGYWHIEPERPRFFADGLYRTCLREDENLLVIPYGQRGESMLWQAESDFYFRQAGGYISPVVPESFEVFPGFGRLRDGLAIGEEDVLRFAEAKGITTIVVVEGDTREQVEWNAMLRMFVPERTAVGGVVLYPIAPGPATSKACRGA